MKSNPNKFSIKTIETQFKNPKIDIHLHFWTNEKTDMHSHEFFEFVLVTDGKVNHFFNDTVKTISRGMLCLIKPGDIHQFLPIPNYPSTHCNIRLKPFLFQNLCRIIHPSLHDLLLNETSLIKYELNNIELDYIFYHLANAKFTFDHVSGEDYVPVTTAIATNFLLYLNSIYKNKNTYPKWFADFLRTLNSIDALSKPLSTLYKESGYSQRALSFYFKKYTGKTLVAYMIERKISHACFLLKTSNLSIINIAMESSFNNLSNFNTMFKKHIGLTPREYRNKYKGM